MLQQSSLFSSVYFIRVRSKENMTILLGELKSYLFLE